ncbi:FAD-dependent monooxygenase [Actinocorallia sp. A-T 12471]|uniref:FAD-dependent monooxygenase n=1 Tax=Actinocorallia sp. A-T 12471 TaxID=3089813 RepID=UPI0029D22E6E|nr:FAD-dependent monooxygenase [Actinocorallia sp. A-T 12471]MDX6741560.1 FAD-dependent monooxygenase [Actinocorallia sp. A-T 12471]
MTPSPLPVLVVGAGPVGLTMANLLAARGVPVVLVERNATTSDEAKAISLDDESLRTLQSAGLADAVMRIVVPGTGTRYYDRKGRQLFHARGPEPYRLGYPFKNQFAQPELERALLDALAPRENVTTAFSTELVDVADAEDGVRATLRDVATDETRELAASWLLACDGGRSILRELKKIDMTGTSHKDVWLVADTLGDAHDERYGMHHGTPERPTVIVPGRDGRCRYEFRLRPGEGTGGTRPDFATIQRLVAPHRTIAPEQVERCINYTFNAVVADRWRDGRCFLLGDAAHMMPPFAGQGLNSGVRDAANLGWKVAEVWHGRASDALLDTYEPERRPHATAMVAFSERLGRVVMTTDARRALLRDVVVRALLRSARGRRYLAEMRFRPRAVHADGLVVRTGRGDERLVGTQLPQPLVLAPSEPHPRRLDAVLGEHPVLLGVDVPAEAWDALVAWPFDRVDVVLGERLPRATSGRRAVADADGRLAAALGSARGRFVLVKPDRYVAAVFAADDHTRVGAALSRHGISLAGAG